MGRKNHPLYGAYEVTGVSSTLMKWVNELDALSTARRFYKKLGMISNGATFYKNVDQPGLETVNVAPGKLLPIEYRQKEISKLENS